MSLSIYHAGTGTVIRLSDECYVINDAFLDDDVREALELGVTNMPPQLHKGYRIDNYNMTNLFFGGAE